MQLDRNVVNGFDPMLRLIGDLPAGTPVAFEVAYGWGWLVELLEDYGFDAHLVHPLPCKAIASARLGNDKVDAAILAQLRADLLPEARIAPPQLRHRASLTQLGTQLRNRIHAVAADFGYDRTGSYWTGPGRGRLAELDLPRVSREIVTDCLPSIDALAPVIERLDSELHRHAKADPRVKMQTALPGVGQFTAPVMLAEIGGITRFPSARKLLTRAYHLLAAQAAAAPARRRNAPARPDHRDGTATRRVTKAPACSPRGMSRPSGPRSII